MFIAALFITARTRKQPRRPLLGEWIKCYIQTMECYYSMLKRNERFSHVTTWRDFKCMLVSERNQSERAMYCMSLTIWHSERGKAGETVKRLVVK